MEKARPVYLNRVVREIIQKGPSDNTPSLTLIRTLSDRRSSIIVPHEGEKRGINGVLSTLVWGNGNFDTSHILNKRELPEAINDKFYESTEAVLKEMLIEFSQEARTSLEKINMLPDNDLRKRLLVRASQFFPFQGLPISPVSVVTTSLEGNFQEALRHYQAILPLAEALLTQTHKPSVEECLTVARDSFSLINGYTGLDDKVFEAHKKTITRRDGNRIVYLPNFFRLEGTRIVDTAIPAPIDPSEPYDPNRVLPQCGGKISSATVASLLGNKPKWSNMVHSSYNTFLNRIEMRYVA